MTIDNQEEYTTPDHQTICIQRNVEAGKWEVSCWNSDDSNHWYLEFTDEAKAKAEFNRWKS